MQWQIQQGGALPPYCAILGIVRMYTKFIHARAAEQTEKKGGPGPPGSATDMGTALDRIVAAYEWMFAALKKISRATIYGNGMFFYI